ncbi:uncharacterized protein LOC62_01G000155 [Vanrija pseudolonga]|uniref:Uncharacterized protein n=1 Tax=Vanrija pseudolonga TaxID=143232 RepID=A0AAF1BMB7_9TREE|nr:hypothetical protein LOC62_01G000155 [Vanrija pseudolonga]
MCKQLPIFFSNSARSSNQHQVNNTMNFPHNSSNVTGPYWPVPLPAGYAVCNTDNDTVTDACCRKLNGAIYEFNPAAFGQPPAMDWHHCLIIPPKDSQPYFVGTEEAWSICTNENRTNGSYGMNRCINGAGRKASLGLVGLVWVAVGFVLAV